MVDDPLRTVPLLKSIQEIVEAGDIVADIGAGLGILSIEAARSGAKKVFAIEYDIDAALELTSKIKKLKLEDAIEVISEISFDVELATKANVIICETVGSFAFDENILSTLLDAKQNLLARGGVIIPERLELFGAPLTDIQGPNEESFIDFIDTKRMASKPTCISNVIFSDSFEDAIHETAYFEVLKDCTLEGIALWPRVTWHGTHFTDASPEEKPTHWKQGICRLEKKKVRKGERIGVELVIEPHPASPLTMTERLWRWK